MDQNLKTVVEKRIQRTVDALCANRFDAHYIKSKEELFAKIDQLLPPGASCSVGGSMTLFETGVIDYLEKGDYQYLDRYAKGADIPDVYHKALSCDVYFMSSNAVTENGELYNIDGNGNRVAALIYGPKKVVVIAGANKIVEDIESARKRRALVAAPANTIRLSCDTPCAKTGVCVDCKGPGRICSHEVICYGQRVAGRITVLLLSEDYGY